MSSPSQTAAFRVLDSEEDLFGTQIVLQSQPVWRSWEFPKENEMLAALYEPPNNEMRAALAGF